MKQNFLAQLTDLLNSMGYQASHEEDWEMTLQNENGAYFMVIQDSTNPTQYCYRFGDGQWEQGYSKRRVSAVKIVELAAQAARVYNLKNGDTVEFLESDSNVTCQVKVAKIDFDYPERGMVTIQDQSKSKLYLNIEDIR